ncbi:MAG TPA: class I SAM-dependent methyltransferase, partial [Conexibacter sp.]|nr:class I SAM-dependent methyltransferase [Conexibacter sp.]
MTDAPPAPGSAYERLSYPGYAYTATHPARLEAVGRLLGLDPAGAAGCRVLELGCGDGGNALSIAATLPDARVLGIDAAASAVARGTQLAEAAALGNVELRAGDFAALADELPGTFDYVIAHGVYSWIPPEARVALLTVAAACLAPHGIAFLSYNAYPGSYLRDMARDVLHFHLRGVEDPQARLDGAHELMRAIVAIEEPSPYARALREQLGRMLDHYSDALLFHDDLAEISTPFYLHEVVEHATRHGLRYLAEADLHESLIRDVPDSAEQLMARLPDDAVVREQYLDFFKSRMFRQTLLCRAEVAVGRALDDRAIERLAISSSARPAERDLHGGETFTTPSGFAMTTSEPHVRAAMHALAQAAPGALAFAPLLDAAREAAGPDVPAEPVAARLRELLLEAHLARVVALHGCAPPLVAQAGERPRASALARAQHAAGAPAVSSLLHANV